MIHSDKIIAGPGLRFKGYIEAFIVEKSHMIYYPYKMTRAYHRKADILFQRFDDETLLFDLKKNVPYILNGVASFIFSMADAGLGREEIAEKMSREFQVSHDRSLRDITAILQELLDKGIIREAV